MRAARTDANQEVIVNELRKFGITVFVASGFGNGFPDLVIPFRGFNFFIEIKTETGKLTKAQIKFKTAWQLAGGQYAACTTTEQVLEEIGAAEFIERLANIARTQV